MYAITWGEAIRIILSGFLGLFLVVMGIVTLVGTSWLYGILFLFLAGVLVWQGYLVIEQVHERGSY